MIGEPFIHLSAIDSTNLYATKLIDSKLAVPGMAILADLQTAGRGQRGKQWESLPGENILLSLILDTHPLDTQKTFLLSMAMALGCRDFLLPHLPEDLCIKWPNDLYWRDRKAGGILIENRFQGKNWQWAVVGIGLNINQTVFPGLEKKAVSLKQITGKTFDHLSLSKALLSSLSLRWKQILTGETKTLLADYNACLYGRVTPKTLRVKGAILECQPLRVDDLGQLWVQTPGGEKALDHADVVWEMGAG